MLLGNSNGDKFQPFLVFKTQRSQLKERHEENVRELHGFGKAVWREA